MVKPKSRPFKKFYCDRPEVFLLPPAAFKIWMYHYSREGVVRESWPSLETICEALDLGIATVKRARAYLVENGWLEKTGERDRSSGEFKVPVMKVKRGSIPTAPKHRKDTTVKSPKDQNDTPVTGVSKLFSRRGSKVTSGPGIKNDLRSRTTNTSRTKKQGDGSADALVNQNPAAPLLPSVAGGSGKIQEPQYQNDAPVDSRRTRLEYLKRIKEPSQVQIEEELALKKELGGAE